ITDLMVLPGLINLDFADVRTVMAGMGKAMMGTGEAGGEDRALMAAQNAIQNPLLDEVSLKGAKAVLVNVTGGLDMTLLEVDEAANAISAEVDPDANIIFGAAFDPALEGRIRVSVVATGMDAGAVAAGEVVARPAYAPIRPAAPPPQLHLRSAEAARAAAPAPVAAESRSFEPEAEQTPDLWSEPAAAEAPPAAAASRDQDLGPLDAQPAIRIIDPAVSEDDEMDELELSFDARPEPAIQAPRNYSQPEAVEHRRAPPANPLP